MLLDLRIKKVLLDLFGFRGLIADEIDFCDEDGDELIHRLELASELEVEFSIDIDDSEIFQVRRLQDVVDLVKAKL